MFCIKCTFYIPVSTSVNLSLTSVYTSFCTSAIKFTSCKAFLIYASSKVVNLREGSGKQRVVVDLLVELRPEEVQAAVVTEGAPLDVDAHVGDAIVLRFPVRHTRRSLHVASVWTRAQYYTDLEVYH